MADKRQWWEAIADTARAQMMARIAANPELEQHRGGTGPRGVHCVYAARSEDHALSIHDRRMAAAIRRRKAADEHDPPPAHRASPYCPSCASPCGTTDREDLSGLWVACAYCGHSWQDRDDREQAERADRAYAQHRDDEAQRERDEARVGPELLEVNARMLEEAEARREGWTPREQLAMFPT